MSRSGRALHDDVRGVAVNLVANVIWLALIAAATAATVFVAQSSEGGGLSAALTVPTWLVLLFSLISICTAIFVFVTNKKASVVRGRTQATQANVELLASRRRLDPSRRVVRSTRFGRWPAGENLAHRTDFRQELDKAILDEGSDVKRIWNVRSADEVRRLREVLLKYEGRDNHSIRAYFGVPYHIMPELLIVENCGASISFASTRTPNGLDWAVHVKRSDLVQVIRDYFDVLWDRAVKILDSGEVTEEGAAALNDFEAKINRPSQS